ncbi:O-antigen ligase family protein [Bacillus gobiensis]|uniref:O-antigen ligase family protein n=1 Tax=Bacillus gobiensis TaxID=1441095 RepID=UPI003D1A0DF1
MNWFTFVCLSIVFLITPFQWGLYYEQDIRLWEWLIFALFILNVIWYWVKEPEVLIKNKLYLLVLLLPFMYVITVPFALNQEGNWNTIFRFSTYAFFFLLLIWTKESPRINRLYPYVFHVLGAAFLLFAVANLFGLIRLDMFMVGCEPTRSCGPVRYPNTFGAIMGAYWFYIFAIFIRRKSFRWVDGLLILLLAGYGAILLHTYSRGSYIFFAGTFALAFLLLIKQWKKFILFFASALVLFLVAFNLLTFDQHKGIRLIPDSLITRISEISLSTQNAVTRFDFYKEALAMSKESPLIGFGGDSWTIYYPKYANRLFGLNQVHNGYLDFLIEIGWIGLAVYALFFGLMVFLIFKSGKALKHRIGVILALTMLFGHGMVDYDFSYGTYWLLIFWLIAVGVGVRPFAKEDVVYR